MLLFVESILDKQFDAVFWRQVLGVFELLLEHGADKSRVLNVLL